MTDKAAHLLDYINLDHPRLAAVKVSAAPAEALVKYLAAPPRPRFWLEVDRKAELLDYLQSHYEAWRRYDRAPADRVAARSIEDAQAPRGLPDVALLGEAWWATGDPAYGAAFERFYRAVPTGKMFSWYYFNGIQAGLEVEAYHLLLDCPGFTVEGRIAFLDHLFAIANDAWDSSVSRWSSLMLGPEGHNWWLHGVRGLPAVGLMFPECKRSDYLLRSAWSVVEEHVRGHYKADGGARETSAGYQVGSMMNLWEILLVARRNGYPVSADLAEGAWRATRYLLHLMTPSGCMPQFGDDHDGANPGELTAMAAVAAAMTGDREFKWYAEYARARRAGPAGESPDSIPQSAFWQVGLEGARAYAAIRPKDPRATSVLMGPTGYAAMRTGLTPDALHLAVAAADRGPMVTSHGHNNIFSIEVHAHGIRFIGEKSDAPYGISPGRDYDQKTEAHSCFAIEGLEQTPLIDEWRWDGVTIPCVRRWISEPTHDFFHGVHEGYYRPCRHEILHARKVFFVKAEPAYWIVLDCVESSAVNRYQAYFHGCVPGRIEGRAVVLGEPGGPSLTIVPPGEDALELAQVRSDGLDAYIREKHLDAERYPCFAFGMQAQSGCWAWVLAPRAAGDTRALPRVRRLPVTLNGAAAKPEEAVALEIAWADATDSFCLSHKDFDAPLAWGAHSAWGLLAFRRAGTGNVAPLEITHAVADGVCGR